MPDDMGYVPRGSFVAQLPGGAAVTVRVYVAVGWVPYTPDGFSLAYAYVANDYFGPQELAFLETAVANVFGPDPSAAMNVQTHFGGVDVYVTPPDSIVGPASRTQASQTPDSPLSAVTPPGMSQWASGVQGVQWLVPFGNPSDPPSWWRLPATAGGMGIANTSALAVRSDAAASVPSVRTEKAGQFAHEILHKQFDAHGFLLINDLATAFANLNPDFQSRLIQLFIQRGERADELTPTEIYARAATRYLGYGPSPIPGDQGRYGDGPPRARGGVDDVARFRAWLKDRLPGNLYQTLQRVLGAGYPQRFVPSRLPWRWQPAPTRSSQQRAGTTPSTGTPEMQASGSGSPPLPPPAPRSPGPVGSNWGGSDSHGLPVGPHDVPPTLAPGDQQGIFGAPDAASSDGSGALGSGVRQEAGPPDSPPEPPPGGGGPIPDYGGPSLTLHGGGPSSGSGGGALGSGPSPAGLPWDQIAFGLGGLRSGAAIADANIGAGVAQLLASIGTADAGPAIVGPTGGAPSGIGSSTDSGLSGGGPVLDDTGTFQGSTGGSTTGTGTGNPSTDIGTEHQDTGPLDETKPISGPDPENPTPEGPPAPEGSAVVFPTSGDPAEGMVSGDAAASVGITPQPLSPDWPGWHRPPKGDPPEDWMGGGGGTPPPGWPGWGRPPKGDPSEDFPTGPFDTTGLGASLEAMLAAAAAYAQAFPSIASQIEAAMNAWMAQHGIPVPAGWPMQFPLPPDTSNIPQLYLQSLRDYLQYAADKYTPPLQPGQTYGQPSTGYSPPSGPGDPGDSGGGWGGGGGGGGGGVPPTTQGSGAGVGPSGGVVVGGGRRPRPDPWPTDISWL